MWWHCTVCGETGPTTETIRGTSGPAHNHTQKTGHMTELTMNHARADTWVRAKRPEGSGD